jgi:hypothetical protein
MIRYILICLFITFVFAQQADLVADFVKTGAILSGVIRGTIRYSPSRLALSFQFAGSKEIEKFDISKPTEYFIYQECTGGCTVYPKPDDRTMPHIYWESTDTCESAATAHGSVTCIQCTKKADSLLTSVCIDSLTTKKVMRFSMKDGYNYDLSNHGKAVITTADFDTSAWGCSLVCNIQIDIALVLDESNSISGNHLPGIVAANAEGEFGNVRKFVIAFTNLFEYGPEKVNLGYVIFSRGSRIILPYPSITGDTATITNQADKTTKTLCGTKPAEWNTDNNCRGATWIGAGILDGAKILADKTGAGRAARAGFPKYVVLVTDGKDTQESAGFDWQGRRWATVDSWLNYVTGLGIKIISVGVGNADELDIPYLNKIAAVGPDGKKLVIIASNFDDLQKQETVDKIGKLVCTANGKNPDCNGDCKGLCECSVCDCPDCNDGNKCHTGRCDQTTNGCFYTDVICNSKSKCLVDSCDAKTGCKTAPVDCNDNNPCTIDSCDALVGCLHIPKVCGDGNPCFTSTCNSDGICSAPVPIDCDDNNNCTSDSCSSSAGGCIHSTVNCDFGNKCFDYTCDIKSGCKATAKPGCTACTNAPCVLNPSKNVCKIDICDPDKLPVCSIEDKNCDDKNACTDDTCDSVTGCKHVPKNCDDKDACTVDTCDAVTGCKHVQKSCDSGNKCSIFKSCDKTSGTCTYEPLNCADNDECTLDTCDPSNIAKPCQNKKVNISTYCNDGNACTDDTCNPTVKGGCVNTPRNCPAPNGTTDLCTLYFCDPISECTFKVKQCNSSDPNCYVSQCNAEKGNCEESQIDLCKYSGLIGAVVGTTLGAIAIAGIVIAAVVCAGGTVGAAVLGYNKLYKGEFENKNPLYVPDTKVATSGIYNANS